MSLIEVFSAREKLVAIEDRKTLYDIIVKAYADTESEMWGEEYVRIPFTEYEKLVHADQLLVAFCDHQIAGGLRVFRQNKSVFSFGLFGAKFNLSGKGIGRALIKAAECRAITNGGSSMNIEILRPSDFELPIKTKLHNWYLSMGYKLTNSKEFTEVRPTESKKLLVPCRFDFYEKHLIQITTE